MAERLDAGPLAPLVSFGRDLRAAGLPVGTGRILTFCRAIAALGLRDRDSLYWAGRTSLVARKDDIERLRRGVRRLVPLARPRG